MSSERERLAWLVEHLRYEHDMLRFSYGRLQALGASKQQGEFNIAFEAFVVHARNLYDFITNDGGSTNFNANDYVGKFRSGPTGNISPTVNRLNGTVFHMGKSRPSSPPGKFNLGDCARVYDWLRPALQRFEDQLSEPYKGAWQAASRPAAIVISQEVGASATNHITDSSTKGVSPDGPWEKKAS